MKANLQNKEKEFLARWHDQNLPQIINDYNAQKPPFIIHDGPPYANGELHIGHAFNKILKDILVRYYNNAGFYSPFILGWDTHGLPIEVAVLKKGFNPQQLSVDQFRKECAKYADQQISQQASQLKLLGLLTDFDQKYVTKNWSYELAQLEFYQTLISKGLIYRGLKPVHWSPSSQSVLADAEIEYRNLEASALYCQFKIEENQHWKKLGLPSNCYLPIWTTTPWTIPCNQLLAVGVDLEYNLLRHENQHYLVAASRLNTIVEELQWSDYQILKNYQGHDLVGLTSLHPFYQRSSLVVEGFHVTSDIGTGVVHVAPGFGEEDYEIGLQHNLSAHAPLNNKGCFTDEIQDPDLVNVFYAKANHIVIDKLKRAQALLGIRDIEHSVAVDWRTKKPVIYRATEQWFVNIKKIKPSLIQAIADVNWKPAWAKEHMLRMIKKRQDWCISRQRSWGIPLIAFYDQNDRLQVSEELVAHAIGILKNHQSCDAWFTEPADAFLPAKLQKQGWRKELNIIDVWFDSGISSSVVLPEHNLQPPADVVFEGNDQFRGWFNSSLIIGVIKAGRAPYKNVLTHGFVNDAHGFKMSKSKNNFISINKFLKQESAEILRLWVASSDYTSDIKYAPHKIQQVKEQYRRFRNTLRFLVNNLEDFTFETDWQKQLNEVDLFIINKLIKLQTSVNKLYEKADYQQITILINNFITYYLSSFYLDFSKDVLYVEHPNAKKRRQVQTTLYVVLHTLVDLLKPILVFTTEELHDHLQYPARKPSVHLKPCYQIPFSYNESVELVWDQLMLIKKDINLALEQARNQKIVNKSAAAAVHIVLKPALAKYVNYRSQMETSFILGKVIMANDHDATWDAYDTAWIKIQPKAGVKCTRCWRIADQIDANEVCVACAKILKQLETVTNHA